MTSCCCPTPKRKIRTLQLQSLSRHNPTGLHREMTLRTALPLQMTRAETRGACALLDETGAALLLKVAIGSTGCWPTSHLLVPPHNAAPSNPATGSSTYRHHCSRPH